MEKLFIILLLLIASLAIPSCSDDITHKEYIIGFAGTSGISFPESDSSIVTIHIDAYKFENPRDLEVKVNEKKLNKFEYLSTGSAAALRQNIKVPTNGYVHLDLNYGGRQNSYSEKLLPKLHYASFNLNYDNNTGVTTVNWTEIDNADYYSIDVFEYIADYVVWDTLLVNETELSFSREFFGSTDNYRVYITAIKGPLPDENFYNLEGDIAGQFLLASQSYLLITNPAILDSMNTKPKVFKSEPLDSYNLIMSNILDRYKN